PVPSGQHATCVETLAVAPGAPFGTTRHCHVDFLLNGISGGSAFGEDISITVPAHATTLTYTGDKTQDYHDQATLSAHLVDAVTGQPVAGKTVNLSMGSQSCSPAPTTDINGNASCSI